MMKIWKKNRQTNLELDGRLIVKFVAVDDGGICGGFGFLIGFLKSKCCAATVNVAGATAFVLKLWPQHEPNINESTHMPKCCPSDLMHSHTNMHVPSNVFTVHGFGWILKLVLLPGIELANLQSRSI